MRSSRAAGLRLPAALLRAITITVHVVIVLQDDRRYMEHICEHIGVEIERFTVALADWMQASW